MEMRTVVHFFWLLATGFWLLANGCGDSGAPPQEVVLYTSVDQPIAAPIVKEFEQKTGIVPVQAGAGCTRWFLSQASVPTSAHPRCAMRANDAVLPLQTDAITWSTPR